MVPLICEKFIPDGKFVSTWVFLHDSDMSDMICMTFTLIHVCITELGLIPEVTELLNECEHPSLVQSLLLPEDLALRHLPALSVAHRRLDFTRHNPSLSPLQEVHENLDHLSINHVVNQYNFCKDRTYHLHCFGVQMK